MNSFEYTVVGAGVIGLSVARALSLKKKNVLVLEKLNSFGLENSSRNSGVVHAGIYYNNNSLKKKLCIEGRKLLEKYVKDRSINYVKCGKLIISSNPRQDKILSLLKEKALKNGVKLTKITKEEISKIEQNLVCSSCLFSEHTAVINPNDLMLNFINDIKLNSGTIRYNFEVTNIMKKNGYISFSVNHKKEIFKTKYLINCAGLGSFNLIKLIKNYPTKTLPNIRYIKGNYMIYKGKNPFSKLIYPLPNTDGLGIHSTIQFDGSTIFGPDSRETKDINFQNSSNIKDIFFNSIKKYWPDIEKKKLVDGFCGVRTKLFNDDFVIQDYDIHGIKGLVNLLGIDSPGLTSSISIAEYVVNRINKS